MASSEFEPMVKWGQPPADVDSKLGTVGKDVGTNTTATVPGYPVGRQSYAVTRETHFSNFYRLASDKPGVNAAIARGLRRRGSTT